MKQLGVHFASKQPKLMFRYFDCENGTAELTLTGLNPNERKFYGKAAETAPTVPYRES